MALPTSRERTYIDGATQIPAADMNSIQDWIIDMYAGAHGKHGDRIISVPASGMEGADLSLGWATKVTATHAMDWEHTDNVNASFVSCPIPLTHGDRIKGAKVFVSQSTATAGLLTVTLYRQDLTSPGTLVAKSDAVATPATSGNLTIVLTGVVVEELAPSFAYFLKIAAAASASVKKIFGAEITYDRLVAV
jgi:hypothetical protein